MSAPGYTNVTAVNLRDASGLPISNATATITPNLSFRTGGAHGQTVTAPVTAVVTNGALSIPLADTSISNPANVSYRLVVTDDITGSVLLASGYENLQPSGSDWSLDEFVTPIGGPLALIVAGPQGNPGTNGRDGNFGKTAAATTTADYSLANASNFLPTATALPQGVTYFDNGSEFCGDDLGHNFGIYGRRFFSSTGLAQYQVFAPSGTRPTGDNSYTLSGWYVTPNYATLFADIANNANPKHSYTRDGDAFHARNLSIAGDFHASNSSFSGLVTGRTFQAFPNGGISSNDFVSCNSAGNLPNPASGYAGGYAVWKDGSGNNKCFIDFNTVDYGMRFAQQPGWKFHFATVGSGSSNANDCADFAYLSSSAFVYGPLTIDPSGNITTPGSISAGIAASGDAIIPTQFPPAYQAKTDALSRTYAPSGYKIPWAGYTYAAYGDSITYGLYASNPATTGYVPLVAAAIGALAIDNQGVSSDIVLDTTRRAFNHENCSSSSKRRFSVQVGTNDDHITTGILDWKPFHLAVLSWLATVAEDRVDGHTVTAANWSDDTTYSAVTGKTCSTAGASISYNVATYGKPLYIWYQTFQSRDGNGNTVFGTGAFTVQVDGGAAVAVNSFPDGGQPGQTGGTGVKLLRLIVPAGAHTVNVTSTTSGKTTIVSLGTPSRNSYYDSPFVAVGGVIPEKSNVEPRSITYTDWAMDNVRLLQSDGLDVRAVPNRVAMQNGLASLYSDQYHPNDAGYAALAQPYIEAMQRPPDTRYVSQWTPRTSASIGTPADAWSDDNFIYGVRANGSITKSATVSI